jgi:hypothetical protein
MCGTAAPAIEPHQPPSVVSAEFSGADHERSPSSSDSQKRLPKPGLRVLIPVFVILVLLSVVTWFFHRTRKDDLPETVGSAPQPTARSERLKLENAADRQIVHNSVRGVEHVVAAKLGAAQTNNAAIENDPVELWKAIKRGSVSAEVALAKLYVDGMAVSQSCEQAHILLLAASMKGSKAADNFLKSSYAERCE